jgi:hypothetical protein
MAQDLDVIHEAFSRNLASALSLKRLDDGEYESRDTRRLFVVFRMGWNECIKHEVG